MIMNLFNGLIHLRIIVKMLLKTDLLPLLLILLNDITPIIIIFISVNYFRSVRNKVGSIAQSIINSKCLITAITETWLTDNDSALSLQLTSRGYNVILANRSTPSRGGGLSLVYSSNLKLVFSTIPSVSS